MSTDEALYRAYLDGDDSGLTLLMDRYGNRLTFYINGYIYDMYDSEDLMIEAFALGVSVTILSYKIKLINQLNQEDKEDKDD